MKAQAESPLTSRERLARGLTYSAVGPLDVTRGVVGLGVHSAQTTASEPVSYTHLDVYKRQAVPGALGSPGGGHPARSPIDSPRCFTFFTILRVGSAEDFALPYDRHYDWASSERDRRAARGWALCLIAPCLVQDVSIVREESYVYGANAPKFMASGV